MAKTILIFTVTYPLDLTKTRLQIQGEVATKKNAPVSILIFNFLQ